MYSAQCACRLLVDEEEERKKKERIRKTKKKQNIKNTNENRVCILILVYIVSVATAAAMVDVAAGRYVTIDGLKLLVFSFDALYTRSTQSRLEEASKSTSSSSYKNEEN